MLILRQTSNLYCSAHPIFTAVRLPFAPAVFVRKCQELGIPEVPDTHAALHMSQQISWSCS